VSDAGSQICFRCVERRNTSQFRLWTAAGTVAVVALVLGACGGGEKQEANEPSGTWKLDVLAASFPGKQHLGEETTLQITVKNADDREVPNLAVTVDGFDQRREDVTLADPKRPIWIVNTPPRNAASAFTNTWSLGAVPAGQTRTFEWKVTAVRAGTYSLRYRVAAGLDGKAKAVLADGSPPKGSFIARVTRKPRPVTIGVPNQTEEATQ
jgi:hypothetical protein